MQLQIPSIGHILVLERDWTFVLTTEKRNASLLRALALPAEPTNEVTLPAGTVLRIESIEVRQRAKPFDSVGFRIVECPLVQLEGARFGASLGDVNRMDVEQPR